MKPTAVRPISSFNRCKFAFSVFDKSPSFLIGLMCVNLVQPGRAARSHTVNGFNVYRPTGQGTAMRFIMNELGRRSVQNQNVFAQKNIFETTVNLSPTSF